MYNQPNCKHTHSTHHHYNYTYKVSFHGQPQGTINNNRGDIDFGNIVIGSWSRIVRVTQRVFINASSEKWKPSGSAANDSRALIKKSIQAATIAWIAQCCKPINFRTIPTAYFLYCLNLKGNRSLLCKKDHPSLAANMMVISLRNVRQCRQALAMYCQLDNSIGIDAQGIGIVGEEGEKCIMVRELISHAINKYTQRHLRHPSMVILSFNFMFPGLTGELQRWLNDSSPFTNNNASAAFVLHKDPHYFDLCNKDRVRMIENRTFEQGDIDYEHLFSNARMSKSTINQFLDNFKYIGRNQIQNTEAKFKNKFFQPHPSQLISLPEELRPYMRQLEAVEREQVTDQAWISDALLRARRQEATTFDLGKYQRSDRIRR